MTLTMELTAEQEARLYRQAASAGVDAAEYLRRLLDTDPLAPAMTGQVAWDYWQKAGVIGTFADRPDSPDFARELRDAANARRS